MIYNISTPSGEVLFIRMGANFIIRSNAYSPGTKAEFVLTFTEWPATNDGITITFIASDGTITLPFLFKTNPQQSGLELLRSTAYGLQAYLALVRLDFLKNYYIDKYFNLTVGTGTITFKSKENAALTPDVTFPVGNHVTKNVTANGLADYLQLANYKTYVATKKGTTILGEDFIPVIYDPQLQMSVGEIDVADYCLPEIVPKYSITLGGSSKIEESIGIIESFNIQAADCYDDPPIIKGLMSENTSTFIAMKGGVGKLRQAQFNEASYPLYSYLSNAKKFLSWLPTTIKIDRRIPSSLFYLHYDTSTTIKVYAKVYWTNGGTQTHLCDTKTGCSKYKVYEVTTAPDALFTGINLGTITGHYIYKFDFWLADANTNPLTEVRTFEIDYTPYQHLRYYRYLNSLGVFDTIRVTGVFEKSKEYESQTIEKSLQADFVPSDFEKQRINISKQETFKASTGWFNKESEFYKQLSEVFEELFLSPEPYEYCEMGFMPIVISKPDHMVGKDDENLRAITYEVQKTYKDDLFTNVTDSGTELGNGGYFGQGFGAGFLVDPGTLITQPLGS
jgi:hypothetical protein